MKFKPSGRLLKLLAVGGAIVILFFSTSCFADSLNLGAAGQFGIVADNGVAFGQNNGNISGNIAIGTGATFNGSGPSTITGQIVFADCIGTSGGCNGVNTSQGGVNHGSNITNTTVTGGTASNATQVSNAIGAWESLSSFYSSQSGTALDLSNVNANRTITVGSGTTIFNVGNVLVHNANLTISGAPGDVVVFNISGNVTFTGEQITLVGLTPDQVLFNIFSTTGNNFSSSGGGVDTVAGDFLDLNGNINLNEIVVNGRIFGGGTAMQLVSNFNLNAPPNTMTPEPASMLLLGTGLFSIAGLTRKRIFRK